MDPVGLVLWRVNVHNANKTISNQLPLRSRVSFTIAFCLHQWNIEYIMADQVLVVSRIKAFKITAYGVFINLNFTHIPCTALYKELVFHV